MKYRLAYAVAVFCCAAVAAHGACVGATSVSCGSTLSGLLAAGDCSRTTGGWFDQYSIFLEESEEIQVEATASNAQLPIVVSIFDADDRDLLRSSSGAGRAVVSYDAVDSMVVIIEVYTPNAGGGAYTLRVSCPGNTNPTCEWSGDMTCGGSAIGRVETGECGDDDYYEDYYRLTLAASDRVEISADGDFPLYLAIYRTSNAGGLGYDGTYTGGTLAVNLDFTAPVAATYTIEIGASRQFETGSYSLTVSCTAGGPCRRRAVRH